jgi:hypothetical protein
LDLEIRLPKEQLFRIGRRPNPWAPPDWSNAHDDGTFGNRFDDPKRRYRVIYASSQRLGCYLETLARFRPDLSLLAEFSEIEGENDFTPLGSVPLNWFKKRSMGSARASGSNWGAINFTVADFHQSPRPMVSASTSFHAHQAWSLLGEELHHLTSP